MPRPPPPRSVKSRKGSQKATARVGPRGPPANPSARDNLLQSDGLAQQLSPVLFVPKDLQRERTLLIHFRRLWFLPSSSLVFQLFLYLRKLQFVVLHSLLYFSATLGRERGAPIKRSVIEALSLEDPPVFWGS